MEPTVVMSETVKAFSAGRAVGPVSFSLSPGETVALVGHNGAGKTTLMKLMLGLIRPSSGTVRVLGGDPAQARGSRARLAAGFLPETVAFHHAMTGVEVLDFYARLKGENSRRNGELLDRVGLGEARRQRVGTYSKGMRQRLALAQALLGEPRLLLLDEPTTGLDPALRQNFYDIVYELRQAGATVLMSSHALAELEGRTDRVIIMHQGSMRVCGTLDELRQLACLPSHLRLRFGAAPAGLPDWLRPSAGAPTASRPAYRQRRLRMPCARSLSSLPLAIFRPSRRRSTTSTSISAGRTRDAHRLRPGRQGVP
ncbi:MAG: ABC transporter ATP-binding protein [Magnetospirillum sp.]|nr:ABC transporter ATP-binding protein [Magnetospirillum sp.]